MMLMPVRFGARWWNFWSSSLMAWISGTGFEFGCWSAITFRRRGSSEIRTCFLGDEHSDQHVGGGGKPEMPEDWSSSDEVDPGSS